MTPPPNTPVATQGVVPSPLETSAVAAKLATSASRASGSASGHEAAHAATDTQANARSSDLRDWQSEVPDEPDTLSYSAEQFEDIVSELKPRKELESGPRLASKPPAASPVAVAHAHAGFDDIDDEVTRIAASTSEAMAATAELAAAAAQRAAIQPPTPAAAPQAAPVQAAPVTPKPAGKEDRRLLVLALFFAGTTLMLGVLAAGLFVRAQAAEQAADALAAAPVRPSKLETGTPKKAKAEPAIPTTKGPPAEASKAASAATQTDEAADSDTETASDKAAADETATLAEGNATPAKPAPKPVPKRKRQARPRATAPKATTKTRYVPSDI
jgi:hypothetical protein